MFSATGKRPMYPVVVKLVELFFRPAQVAIFVAVPSERKLRLVEGLGLPDTLGRSAVLEYGQGRPGYVAESRMAMDESDFNNVTTITRLQLESSVVPGLRADVLAPIVYDEELLGVISVGGAAARNDHEKRLLKMVADLTASALVHVRQLKNSQEMANMDGLTETYNKRYLQSRLNDDTHKAESANSALSLMILDIDHFKHYNDTNGHLEGDDVLKRIGAILKSAVRDDTDVVVRYGGEEFVILFPGATKAVASRQAENDPPGGGDAPVQARGAAAAGRGDDLGRGGLVPRGRAQLGGAAARRRPGALRGQGRRPQPHRQRVTDVCSDVAIRSRRFRGSAAAAGGGEAARRPMVVTSTATRISAPPASRPGVERSSRKAAPRITATTGFT